MSSHAPSRPHTPSRSLATFAAALIIVSGTFKIGAGISGIRDDVVLVAVEGYLFGLDTTFWGFTHLVVGLVFVGIGIGVLRGWLLAQVLGVIAAGTAAVLNFLWLPHFPVWGAIFVAVDIWLVWVFATYEPAED